MIRTSYEDYLSTPEWKARSLKIRIRDGGRCRICGKDAKDGNCHHVSYEHMDWNYPGCEPDEDLVWLCRSCHDRLEKLKKVSADRIGQIDEEYERGIRPATFRRMVQRERLIYQIARSMDVEPRRTTSALNIIRHTIGLECPMSPKANIMLRIHRGRRKPGAPNSMKEFSEEIRKEYEKLKEAAEL